MKRSSENKLRTSKRTQQMTKKSSPARRSALKKITLGTVTTGAVASMPNAWVKPVVDAIILPAHATCTVPGCFDVTLRLFEFDADVPGSGNNGSFKIELMSDAPELCEAVTIDSAVVTFGSLVGTTTGQIYTGMPLIFAWTGQVVGPPVAPAQPTVLTVNWTCASGETRSATFDLVDLAITAQLP
jgi:hypothetical protein